MSDNVELKITNLLERKKKIDASSKDKYVDTQRWLCDAVILLLNCELGVQSGAP